MAEKQYLSSPFSFFLPCREKPVPLHSQTLNYKPKKKRANYVVILHQSAKGQPVRPIIVAKKSHFTQMSMLI